MRKFKIDKHLSKIIASLSMAGMIVVTSIGLAGCSKKQEQKNATSIVNMTDNNESKIYGFDFLDSNYGEVNDENKSTVWDLIEKKLDIKFDMFSHMYISSNHSLTHNYELAFFQEELNYDKAYIQVINKDGSLKNGVKYHAVQAINEHMSLLELDDASLYLRENSYIIFNHNTGFTSEIIAHTIRCVNGYIIKSYLDENLIDAKYQLLYPDGQLATKNEYDRVTIDYYTNYIYLVKDNNTTILDTVTGKAKNIDGIVTEATCNYLVISDSEKKSGLYLLDNFNLTQKIENKFYNISISNYDFDNPVFSCESIISPNGYQTTHALYSVNGERLTNDYKYISCDYNNTGYILAVSNSKERIINLIDYSGVEVLSVEGVDVLNILNNTNLISFGIGSVETSKYGIMDFDKNILKEAIFDDIHSYDYLDNNGNVLSSCIIARIEEENKTIVYDSEMNELLSGNYGYYEICKKIDELNILEQLASKKLSKSK